MRLKVEYSNTTMVRLLVVVNAVRYTIAKVMVTNSTVGSQVSCLVVVVVVVVVVGW